MTSMYCNTMLLIVKRLCILCFSEWACLRLNSLLGNTWACTHPNSCWSDTQQSPPASGASPDSHSLSVETCGGENIWLRGLEEPDQPHNSTKSVCRKREQPEGKYLAACKKRHFCPNLTKPDRTWWARIRGSNISHIIAKAWGWAQTLCWKYY